MERHLSFSIRMLSRWNFLLPMLKSTNAALAVVLKALGYCHGSIRDNRCDARCGIFRERYGSSGMG